MADELRPEDKIIYRDYDHWWQIGNHGCTSSDFSRKWTKEIWDDFETTINASRDDYKQMYVDLCKEIAEHQLDYVIAMREYMDLFTKEGSPKFGRWWMDKINAKNKEE